MPIRPALPRRHFWLIGVALAALAITPAAAQTVDAGEIAKLRAELDQLRAQQDQTFQRIQQMQAVLDRAAGGATTALAVTSLPSAPPSPVIAAASPPRLSLSGDFRLRYEGNFGDRDARDRERGVVRARLRGQYAVNSWLTVGGQVATGDPDDPNSTDVTLSNWDDDLQVSLDQAYARATFGDLVVLAGKIPQPFTRTDLVWDGDVSPEGVSATYRKALPGGSALRITGLDFLVDEAVAGPDSSMVGVQVGFDSPASAPWRIELAAGYFDYHLGSVTGADSGDLRTNLMRPDGRYLSDFDLVDAIAALTYQGFGPRWPIKVTADYVKNLGAATGEDTGFGVDALVGRASRVGDWRLGYGYAQAETDAVLAAFSHDNTNIATNYRQHAVSVDYVASANLLLNATYYRYRPLNGVHAGLNAANDWLDRLRLNLLVNF